MERLDDVLELCILVPEVYPLIPSQILVQLIEVLEVEIHLLQLLLHFYCLMIIQLRFRQVFSGYPSF